MFKNQLIWRLRLVGDTQ